jgi:BON domain
MKTDSELQYDVMEELRLEPSVDHSQIGVAAKDGVVTITGFVRTHAEKIAAARAARRVAGVNAVADEVEVHIPSDHHRTDAEMAAIAADTLRWNAVVPHERIKITVSKAGSPWRGRWTGSSSGTRRSTLWRGCWASRA